jgi:hypothetical protein
LGQQANLPRTRGGKAVHVEVRSLIGQFSLGDRHFLVPGRFLIRLCDLVRASSGRNGLISRLPGRGGCLGGPSTKWGGPGRPAGHTAARSGGARVRFPWPAAAHVRFGWATSRLSGGTILRECTPPAVQCLSVTAPAQLAQGRTALADHTPSGKPIRGCLHIPYGAALPPPLFTVGLTSSPVQSSTRMMFYLVGEGATHFSLASVGADRGCTTEIS